MIGLLSSVAAAMIDRAIVSLGGLLASVVVVGVVFVLPVWVIAQLLQTADRYRRWKALVAADRRRAQLFAAGLPARELRRGRPSLHHPEVAAYIAKARAERAERAARAASPGTPP